MLEYFAEQRRLKEAQRTRVLSTAAQFYTRIQLATFPEQKSAILTEFDALMNQNPEMEISFVKTPATDLFGEVRCFYDANDPVYTNLINPNIKIFYGYDANKNRPVALKRYRGTDRTTAQKLAYEARVQRLAQHPHVVEVYGIAETYDQTTGLYDVVVVQEWMEYGTLESPKVRIDQPEEKIGILKAVAQVIDAEARRGIFQRDLNLSNIFPVRNRETGKVDSAKVGDFGRCNIVENNYPVGEGLMSGTSIYLSPERTEGAAVDLRSEIFSLGVVAAEQISPRPFNFFEVDDYDCDGIQRMFRGQLNNPDYYALRLDEMRIEGEPKRVLLKALAKEPADRYATATEFVTALEAAMLAQSQPTSMPAVPDLS